MQSLVDFVVHRFPEFEILKGNKKKAQVFLYAHSDEILRDLDGQQIVDYIGSAYDATAEEYDKDSHTQDFAPNFFNFVGRLNKGSLVLDLGCGHGRDSLYMLEQGMRVIPYDISFNLMQITAEKVQNHENRVPSMVIGDFTGSNTGFRDEEFDAIWACTSLLVHTPLFRLDRAVGVWAKTLKKRGLFGVSYFNPNFEGFKQGYNIRMSTTGEIKIFVSPGEEQVKRAFNNAGLILEEENKTDYVDKPKEIDRSEFFVDAIYMKK